MKITNLTTADLAAELARRQKGAAKLQARRDTLLAQLTGIEKELASLGILHGKRGTPKASTPRNSGKRPKNDSNLGDAIANAAEKGAVLTPAEATERRRLHQARAGQAVQARRAGAVRAGGVDPDSFGSEPRSSVDAPGGALPLTTWGLAHVMSHG